MRRARPPAQTPEQLRRRRVREDFARDLRMLRSEPEEQLAPPRKLAPDERCRCGVALLLLGGRRICADGLDHASVLATLSLQSPGALRLAKKSVEVLRAWKTFGKEDSRGRTRAWAFAETNTGRSMVKPTICGVAKVKVKTKPARQSKGERAAPVSALADAFA
ncbi:hypothetical protein [Pyxidicoccus caerfyrddinensis]|uniref:hypothetical protein n=1 Tax=Pyxidicoccus caerfyrddinensis TaxID=2709663 RepID=UPI0013DD608D|nr:hypothetical protein [Pyxidicoccus caerfyrddinensis]